MIVWAEETAAGAKRSCYKNPHGYTGTAQYFTDGCQGFAVLPHTLDPVVHSIPETYFNQLLIVFPAGEWQ